MPGNYTCVNCGNTDYYYGSPLWAQRCRKCKNPVGIKVDELKSSEVLKEVNTILGAVDGDSVKAARRLIAYIRELEYKLQKCRDEVIYLKSRLHEKVIE